MRFIIYFYSVCLVYSSIVYAIFAPRIPDDITVEESLKDRASQAFAYSNSHYDNIGILHCQLTSWLLGTTYNIPAGQGSVVYIGDGLCLTCAHNYQNSPNITYRVGFQTGRSDFKYYDVESFFVHPKYKKNKSFDIAVLVLNEIPELQDFSGLEPVYWPEGFTQFRDDEVLLTYIGYGAHYSDNNWFMWSNGGERKGQQGYADYCDINQNIPLMTSSPNGYNNALTECRPKIHYHVKASPGRSGGAVFHAQQGLIGIIRG